MKWFLFDLETTGVNPDVNGIHQFGGLIILDKTVDGVTKGEVVERLNFRIAPFVTDVVELEAVKIAGFESVEAFVEASKEWMSPIEFFAEIERIMGKYVNKRDKTDKFHMVGYNCQAFDGQFFRAFYKKLNNNFFGSWFYPNSWDLYVLASPKLSTVRHEMPDFKLSTVAKCLGFNVEAEKAHDADYDSRMTYHILQTLYPNRFKNL